MQTPQGMRRHVGLFGDTNAGKSSLLNALLDEKRAIVSDQEGTTTDPVSVNMEMNPYGPITLIDTAGLDDWTPLGQERLKKTREAMRRCDVAILVIDARAAWKQGLPAFAFPGPVLTLASKCDTLTETMRRELKTRHPGLLLWSHDDPAHTAELKQQLCLCLQSLAQKTERSLVADLLPSGAHVVLVTPLDSQAPAGRLILPQVQLIRELLDHGMQAYICRETELQNTLANARQVDLVVTDSQAFAYVDRHMPSNVPLTSFSMLLARQKGRWQQQYAGIGALNALKDGDQVLLLEACRHNATHQDIGRVKIPALLSKKTSKDIVFDHRTGYDLPEDMAPYQAVILCGSCMIGQAEIEHRLLHFEKQGIPVSNYGMVLAHCQGVLERATEIFRRADTVI